MFFENSLASAKLNRTLLVDDVGLGYIIVPSHSTSDGQAKAQYQNKYWAEYLLRNHCSLWGYQFDLLALYQQLCPNPMQHHLSIDGMIDELSNRMASGELLVYNIHNFISPPPDATGADVPMAGKNEEKQVTKPAARAKVLPQGGKAEGKEQKLEAFDLSCTLPDGEPAESFPYKVKLLSTGATFEGTFDSTGAKHFDSLQPGDVEVTFGKPISESDIEATRNRISQVLATIIGEQRSQAAMLEADYQQLNPLEKGLALTAELGKGLFEAGAGLLEFVDDVHSATSATGYLRRAAAAAWQTNNTVTDDWLATFNSNFNDKNHHALVKALGFDPALISKEMLAEAYEIASFVKKDPATQSALLNFAKDYAEAQHELEWANIGGGALFEIVLTALLAAATGGLGAAGAVAGKARHTGKFTELGQRLKTLSKQLKQKAQFKIKRGQTNGKVEHQIERPDGAEVPDSVKAKENTRLPPKSFEEVISRLKEARERLMSNDGVYQPKYSDDELRAMAQRGTVPKDRFLVRFSVAPKSNSDAIGHVRDSGRHPLWMSTFDQAENGDTDAKTQAALFGTHYDPNNQYVMYIIDQAENFDIDGSDLFVPTFDNMSRKLKDEFEGELSPELIDNVMNKEYAEEFRQHWGAFHDDLATSGKHWTKSFNEHEAERFAKKHFNSDIDMNRFMVRQQILSEIGAWEVFTGDGLTEFNKIKGKPGALEVLEIQHIPESIDDLIAQGRIIKIDLQ